MPNEARIIGEKGYYHIVHSCKEKNHIFATDKNKLGYIEAVSHCRNRKDFILLGYCFMDSHMHMLLKVPKNNIGEVMYNISLMFSKWYNNKNGTKGRVMQAKPKTKNIEDLMELLETLRYIHSKPVRIKLTNEMHEYKWSSYNGYIHNNDEALEAHYILSLLPKADRISSFEKFHETCDNNIYLENTIEKHKIYEIEALEMLMNNYPPKVEGYTKEDRLQMAKFLKREAKISNQKISDLLGIGIGIIERCDKK